MSIATALMPPVCVSGFGLANLDFGVFAGAFYLFFINAVFISISTFFMVRYFDFAPRVVTDRKTRRNIGFAMLAISLVIIFPSVLFLYSIYNQVREKQQIQSLIIEPIHQNPLYEVIEQKIEENTIKLYISSEGEMPDSVKNSFANILLENGLNDYNLQINRVNISKEEI